MTDLPEPDDEQHQEAPMGEIVDEPYDESVPLVDLRLPGETKDLGDFMGNRSRWWEAD